MPPNASGTALSFDPLEVARTCAEASCSLEATSLAGMGARNSAANRQPNLTVSIRRVSQASATAAAPCSGSQSRDEGRCSSLSHDSWRARADESLPSGGSAQSWARLIARFTAGAVKTSTRKGSPPGCHESSRVECCPALRVPARGMCRLRRLFDNSRARMPEASERKPGDGGHDPSACRNSCGRCRDAPAGVAGWTSNGS
jgi:hypothetical protein